MRRKSSDEGMVSEVPEVEEEGRQTSPSTCGGGKPGGGWLGGDRQRTGRVSER